MVNVKPVKLGNNQRMSFAKLEQVMEMPNLIDIQKDSYKWFLEKGLKEVLRDMSEITDFTGNLVLEILDYRMDGEPKYSVKECKERDATYSQPLHLKVRLTNKETGEIKSSEVYMGEFPKMTNNGTFIINGAERVIVSQLVRSPGVYYGIDRDKTGKKLFSTTIIPNRGAWLEYETDQNDIFQVRIDKNKKIPITTFIRALGLSSDEEILEFFGEDERILTTLKKDTTKNSEEALLEIYKKLRPGEPPTLEPAQQHIENLFFDSRRYDLSRVGRYKYNKKLDLATRIKNQELARPIIDSITGEVLAEAGEIISAEKAREVEQMGVTVAYVKTDETEVKVVSNGTVDIKPYIPYIDEEYLEEIGVNEKVQFRVLREILDEVLDDEKKMKEVLREKAHELVPNHITIDDIFASINYLNCIAHNIGVSDDIDHLGNRRIRCVGELLQNQFRIGCARMEKTIKDRMNVQSSETENITPQQFINIKPVSAAIREFFGSSPLSQFMDQTNPLAELTHKRRLSALGPGGLSRDRAGFEVRDVHYSHYGRMCPIETPEGPNIGLISYLATYARINKYGFIEAPFRKVKDGKVLDEFEYMTADREDDLNVAQANEPLDEKNNFINDRVTIRYKDDFKEVSAQDVDFMDVSPQMLVSAATAMIPFLENDDANRALMGSNMQRQAVPLLKPESPIVGTGMEYKVATDSGVVVLAKNDGKVIQVDAESIKIKTKNGIDDYDLIKFMRSNQGTCINQRSIVSVGQNVKKGEVIADGPSTDKGEISLGKNVLIGFMTWEGYNYEDAVLLNEKLVRDDVFTSIHIEKYEVEARDTKLGPEEITRDIPNVGDDAFHDLNDEGIIRVGAEVHSGDILVGKVTPKGETELTPEERLLRAIFGEKAREVRDTSLRVPHGEYGIVANVEVFTRENSDELSPGVNKVVRCYIAQKRKIQVGDKMAGRHGNKGVVSRVLPQEDMPFLPDGTPLDIVLNPLGIPSRMNIGQVLEVNLGIAAKTLGWKIMTPVFDGASEQDVREMLDKAGLSNDGKITLYDGRTGKRFENPITVGIMYFLKLHHLVDDKIHARSTGPYSLVTQQPLGGKAQFGGQRFGEMEVWALEAYGAAYTLQENLTVKSDDIVGRVKTYEAIIKGKNIPKSGVPESFNVLLKELKALSLDVKVLDENGQEVEIKQNLDDGNSVYSKHKKLQQEEQINDEQVAFLEEKEKLESEISSLINDYGVQNTEEENYDGYTMDNSQSIFGANDSEDDTEEE
ncbi:MAG: DNA-directed RNA polymerase subunit beta [Clostridia bacterium]|nr:DNA-directed RNA polymerase subunit beta [Clostridia bacterium]